MARPVRSVAVFCGSRTGHDPDHLACARALGEGIARHGLVLVYGGGSIGLMGAVADAALAAGGEVRGVIPDFLTRLEKPHDGLTSLEVTSSMHERKARMFDLADAFVVLSGGLGTLDEAMEVLTWRQLGLHDKPIVILDSAGWAAPVVGLVEAIIRMGFAAEAHRGLFEVAQDVPATLRLLAVLETEEAAARERL
jgi:uncharacterized protein (TIGR00730 family)